MMSEQETHRVCRAFYDSIVNTNRERLMKEKAKLESEEDEKEVIFAPTEGN